MKRHAVFHVMLLTVVLLTFCSVGFSQAPADLFPQNCVIYLEAKDNASMWERVKLTPVYVTIKDILKRPTIAESFEWKQFQINLDKMALLLGTPLNAEMLMTRLLNRVYIAVTGPDGVGAALIYPKDMATFKKLVAARILDAKEKTLQNKDKETSSTVPKVTEEQYKNYTIVGFSKGLKYCLTETFAIISQDSFMIKGMIDRLKGERSPGLGSVPDFKKAMSGVAQYGGNVNLYLNYMGMFQEALKDQPQMGMFFNVMRQFTGDVTVGMTMRVEKDKTFFASHMPMEVLEGSLPAPLAAKYPPVKRIGASSYLIKKALLASVQNNLDGLLLYDNIEDMLTRLSALLPMMGAASPSETPKGMIDQMVSSFEQRMGFSIRDDLLAAIGPEFGFVISDLQMGMPPSIGMGLVVQVKDKARLGDVMAKVEKVITEEVNKQFPMGMGQMGTPGEASSLQFQPLPYKETTIRSLTLDGQGIFQIGYAFDGDYLLFGISNDWIQKAIDGSRMSSESIEALAEWNTVSPYFPRGITQAATINLEEIVRMLTSLFQMQMAMMGQTDNEKMARAQMFLETLSCFNNVTVMSAETPQFQTMVGIMTFKAPSGN